MTQILCDQPRRYSKRGKRWSHVCSPNIIALLEYATKHGLKRKDRFPWIHYDVTEEELRELPGLTMVGRQMMSTIMAPFRQPRTRKTQE